MDRTSKRPRPRRFGTAIKDDEDGNHPQAVYAGCFEGDGWDSARRTRAETENAFVKRAMTLLLDQSKRALMGEHDPLNITYIGGTWGSGPWNRMWVGSRCHKSGDSGATGFGIFVNDAAVARNFVFRHVRLARPSCALGSQQLEAYTAGIAFVGHGHGLTWAEAGPCRFPRKGEGSNDAHDFFKWASWRGMGDRTVRQALPRVLNKDITLPTHHA